MIVSLLSENFKEFHSNTCTIDNARLYTVYRVWWYSFYGETKSIYIYSDTGV